MAFSMDQKVLQRMLYYSQLIPKMLDGMTFESFMNNEEKMLAVTHALAIIGELERSLTEDCKAKHNAIPWSYIRKTRNIIAHSYSSVDFDTIWETVTQDIPMLIKQLGGIILNET